jgi:hypothetical protein
MSPEQNDLIPAKGTAKRKRGGQHGNTNALELSGHKPQSPLYGDQRSAKRHEALA